MQYFENLAAGLESRLEASQPAEYTARKLLTLEIARLGARLYSGKGKVAWCGVMAPFDLLHAMGVTSCFVEFVGAVLSSSGGVEPMIQEAERTGFSTDSCTYHRAVTGAAVKGLMPDPDFLIGTSAPCSGGLAVIENLAKHFGKDLFVIHVPPDRGKDAVSYLADQYRAMVEFISSHTGEPLDRNSLQTAISNTNRARELLVELFELARAIPSPARTRDLVNFGVVVSLFIGSESGVEIAQAYRDEFARKVESGTAGVNGEKVRLLWLQNRIQFKNLLVDMLAEDYGANVVVDELNSITWEPIDQEDPYTSMARRTLSFPLTSTIERRIDHLKQLAIDYGIDGAINPCHWGCRQGTGVRGLIDRGLKEAGVPILNLEVDCVDPRNFSEGPLKTRMQAFIEMILEQKTVNGT